MQPHMCSVKLHQNEFDTANSFFVQFLDSSQPNKTPFLKLMTKISQTKLKTAFTEELSMERYAACNDNPLAIDYRNFSHLVNSNP